jgi:2',3'-cyclic-nucleotide 2'-phosphodiesterase (5'-nucleotidase family)
MRSTKLRPFSAKNITAKSIFRRVVYSLLLAFGFDSCIADSPSEQSDVVIISVVGTNDLHGAIFKDVTGDGLAVFSGFVSNLRDQRNADNGAVILLDAGDTWQGTMESNVFEGATMVLAFNTLGYTAAAIGNHEFDFGPVGPAATPTHASEDARGALKERAKEANFAFLLANLMDSATGRQVKWPRITPSIITEVKGIKIGIIGGVSESLLTTTHSANTGDLYIAPLTASIESEAVKLRNQGAQIVLLTVHAGGSCTQFTDPEDLSSCNLNNEIFRLANGLSEGLLDVIVGGHVHAGVAHNVNGSAVIASYSRGQAFGRVDLTFDVERSQVIATRIFPPQRICQFYENDSTRCGDSTNERVSYEGQAVKADTDFEAQIKDSIPGVLESKEKSVGIYIPQIMPRPLTPETQLSNLITDILLETTNGADVAIFNAVGGIRAGLQKGPLSYGDIYEVMPFDNEVVTLDLTGAQLEQVFVNQINHSRRFVASIAGLKVVAECKENLLNVSLEREDGSEVSEDEVLKVATLDFLATGGGQVFSPVTPPDGFVTETRSMKMRTAIEQWFEHKAAASLDGKLHYSSELRLLNYPEVMSRCGNRK